MFGLKLANEQGSSRREAIPSGLSLFLIHIPTCVFD